MKIENEYIEEKIILDYYVPISISFPENISISKENNSTTCYYQFISENDSFVELDIDSESKRIKKIIVVVMNDLKKRDWIFEDDISYSNPTLNLNEFNGESVFTNNNNYEICIGERKIFFVINNENVNSMIRISEHVFLILNIEKDIIGIKFSEFNDDDWKILIGNLKEAGKIK